MFKAGGPQRWGKPRNVTWSGQVQHAVEAVGHVLPDREAGRGRGAWGIDQVQDPVLIKYHIIVDEIALAVKRLCPDPGPAAMHVLYPQVRNKGL